MGKLLSEEQFFEAVVLALLSNNIEYDNLFNYAQEITDNYYRYKQQQINNTNF